jgi:hypothetical protein
MFPSGNLKVAQQGNGRTCHQAQHHWSGPQGAAARVLPKSSVENMVELVLNTPVATNQIGDASCLVETTALWCGDQVLVPFVSAHLFPLATGKVDGVARRDGRTTDPIPGASSRSRSAR